MPRKKHVVAPPDPDFEAFKRIGEAAPEPVAEQMDPPSVSSAPDTTPPAAPSPPAGPSSPPDMAALMALFSAQTQVFQNLQGAVKDIQPPKGRMWNQKTPYNPEGLPPGKKPTLTARCFLCGVLCLDDVLTPEEIAAWNALQPGSYHVTKADGSVALMEVEHKTRLDGTVTEKHVTLPIKGDLRHNWPPLTTLLTQATA